MLKNVAMALVLLLFAVNDAQGQSQTLANRGPMPELAGAVGWINSQPLNRAALRGKVVLIDFWTYSCINCLRALPHVKAWEEKYRDAGLVVIGVHTPEFEFEGQRANVENAVRQFGIRYPVALDNKYSIWKAFDNRFWPAHYFIDAKGNIRYRHFGEGEYEKSENVIRQLLAETGVKPALKDMKVQAQGVQAPANFRMVRSPETYIGYQRAENFVSQPRLVRNARQTYTLPKTLSRNDWGLSGAWRIGAQNATLQSAPGKIVFRFHARDLHLVLGPSANGKPVRFKVRLNGAEPGANRGMDVSADGSGTVQEHRLHQLIRQRGPIEDRSFEIEFLDPGVQAFAFTFG